MSQIPPETFQNSRGSLRPIGWLLLGTMVACLVGFVTYGLLTTHFRATL